MNKVEGKIDPYSSLLFEMREEIKLAVQASQTVDVALGDEFEVILTKHEYRAGEEHSRDREVVFYVSPLLWKWVGNVPGNDG